MAEKNPRRNETIDALFDAILSLETREKNVFLAWRNEVLSNPKYRRFQQDIPKWM